MSKPISITKEFLIEEYVNKNKKLADIAKDVNLSNTTMNYYLKKYGIKTHPRNKNIANQTFGYLKVIECIGRDEHTSAIWKCVCICGNVKHLTTNVLTSGDTKSCGCKRYKRGNKNQNWTGFEEISGNWWSTITNNAKARNISVSILIKDIWELFNLQDRKCALTKLPLSFTESSLSRNRSGNVSLDRINSQLPYARDNIQLVLKDINIMKYIIDENLFIYLCKLIADHDDTNFKNLEIPTPNEGKTNNIFWRGCGTIGKSFLSGIKCRGNKKNIPFNLIIEDIWDLYIKQNGRCKLSGIPIYFKKINTNKMQITASLDRIDNDVGYQLNNVQLVHKSINMMRNNLSIKRFKELCFYVATNNKCKDHNMIVPSKEWHESFERIDMKLSRNKQWTQKLLY